ncbi:SRPBCC family protein [Streptomyces sp. NPDC005122]
MMRKLRSISLDGLDKEPIRFNYSRLVPAAPEDLFRALADDVERWPEWFPLVTDVSYLSARPYSRDSSRSLSMKTGRNFTSTVIVFDRPHRYAYRIDTCNVPLMRAGIEEWTLTPNAKGTVVRWRFSIDLAGPAGLLLRYLPGLLTPLIAQAVCNLGRHAAVPPSDGVRS